MAELDWVTSVEPHYNGRQSNTSKGSEILTWYCMTPANPALLPTAIVFSIIGHRHFWIDALDKNEL
jgi:hypothetical protein